MRNPFSFAKPKGPGYGIAKGMYLSVLLAEATPPPIVDLIAPTPAGGAIEGYGVPLAGSDKALLTQPMARGEYALASKDQKTVIRLKLLPVQEAGFDPEVLIRAQAAPSLSGETLARARSAWHLGQFSFEAHDPDVFPALNFLLDLVIRLADRSSGVVADPIARRYLLPAELAALRIRGPVDARAHVSIGQGGGEVFTQGLQKFALPEFVLAGVNEVSESAAGAFLLGSAQRVLEGQVVRSGGRLASGGAAFEVREAFPRGRWDGVPALELLPPTGRTVGEMLGDS